MAREPFTFQGNRRFQVAAERRVYLLLLRHPDTRRVLDVRHVPSYQRLDVDFLWWRGDGPHTVSRATRVEVKGDSYCPRSRCACKRRHSPNYFLETVSSDRVRSPGCFVKSQADLLAYVFLATRDIHWIPLRRAQRWFHEHAGRYPEKSVPNEGYNTLGRPVPRRDLARGVPGILIASTSAPASPPSPAPASGLRCN